MTQEALKLALEALKAAQELAGKHDAELEYGFQQAIAALAEALAQQEQESVAFASIKIRVGNQQVKKLLTQIELHHAIDPWGLVEQAAEMCIEELKEMDT